MLFRQLVLAAVLTATAAVAAPAENGGVGSNLERMDFYYRNPRSPVVYRALAGLGDPDAGGRTNFSYESYQDNYKSAQADLQLLLPDLDHAGWPSHYEIDWRCRMTAPLERLRARRQQLGADHPYFRHWLAVERTVLTICALRQPQAIPSLPSEMATADPGIARLQQQDRAYQYAALLFYDNQPKQAVEAFGIVAADRSSPHRPSAAFMMAAIRAGSVPEFVYEKHDPLVPPEQSMKDIRAILADPSLASVHAISAGLIGWIGAHRDDDFTRTRQVNETLAALRLPLAQITTDAQARARYATALVDIDFLHGDGTFNTNTVNPAWWLNGRIPANYYVSRAMARAARHNPMVPWVVIPTNPYLRGAWAYADRGQLGPEIGAWLGAQIQGAKGTDINNPWVHEAGQADIATLSRMVDAEIVRIKTARDDRAAAALTFDYYHLVRHLLMDRANRAANFEQALVRLKTAPLRRTAVWNDVVRHSLQYLITEGRLTDARRLRDQLGLDRLGKESAVERISQRGLLIVLAEDEDHLVRAVADDNYSPSPYLNGLAIDELWRLAQRREFTPGARALFARTAWTRTYAQGRTIDADHDRLMRTLNPDVVAKWHSPAGRVKADDRLVLRDVLASPGLNLVMEPVARMPKQAPTDSGSGTIGIDHDNHNDNNWWCAWDVPFHTRAFNRALYDDFVWSQLRRSDEWTWSMKPERIAQEVVRLRPALAASFVFRATDRAELAALSKVDCAPKLLTLRTIAWVEHPGLLDSRDGQDEALADAVAATRWGCYWNGGHGAYSRKAFLLLHQKFPNSAAAKRTKYWFDQGVHF